MYVIRPGQADDIPAIIELTELWASEQLSTTGTPEENTVEQLQTLLSSYFWVADQDGQIVGFILGIINGDSNKGEHYQILNEGESYLSLDQLYVHPDHRNLGIGSQLVRQLLSEAKAQGISVSIMHSDNRDWQRTFNFYQKHGFKMWFIKMYRRDGPAERQVDLNG